MEFRFDGEHVETIANLPMHHKYPFDRMIVAQAITEPMRLLTGDLGSSLFIRSWCISFKPRLSISHFATHE